MLKTKLELIKWCESKLGTPYVYGAKGKVLTQAQINTWAKLHPGTFTANYISKAKKYIGKECTDCSGLISWFTGILRGSYNYKDTATQTVPIKQLDETMIGWALWKPGHIGIYIGNGYCIEAKGIDFGCIKSKVSATAWTHALQLCDIDYAEQKKSGWHDEDGGRRFYLGNTGKYIKNDWYQDGENYFWFDASGRMVADTWKTGSDGAWYYLQADGKMATDRWVIWKDDLYRVGGDGRMFMEPVTLIPNQDGALQFPQ